MTLHGGTNNVSLAHATDLSAASVTGASVVLFTDSANANQMLGKINAANLDVYAGSIGGLVTQTDAHTVAGITDISAGGTITLTDAGNQYHGSVGIESFGNNVINLTNSVALSTSNRATGNRIRGIHGGAVTLDVTAAGAVIHTLGRIAASSLSVDAGIGTVLQRPNSNNGDAQYITGDMEIIADGGITLINTTNEYGGAVKLAAGSSSVVDVLAAVDLNATSITGGAVRLRASSANANQMLGEINAASLDVQAGSVGGAVTQTDAHTVAGLTDVSAGGTITLTNAGNQYHGSVGLHSFGSNAISLANSVALITSNRATGNRIRGIRGGGDVTLELGTAGAVTHTLGHIAASSLSVDAGTGTVLQRPPSSNSDAQLITGDLKIVADGGITLINPSNEYGGQVTLTAGSSSTVTLESSVDLDATSITGGAVTLTTTRMNAHANQALGEINAASLDVYAGSIGGSVTQTAAHTVTGITDISAGRTITLTNAGNQYHGSVGLQSFGSTAISLTNSVALITSNRATGNRIRSIMGGAVTLELGTAGAVTHTLGRIAASSLSVDAGTGTVLQRTASGSGDAQSITGATNIQADGGIRFVNSDNEFGGPITLAAGSSSAITLDSIVDLGCRQRHRRRRYTKDEECEPGTRRDHRGRRSGYPRRHRQRDAEGRQRQPTLGNRHDKRPSWWRHRADQRRQ